MFALFLLCYKPFYYCSFCRILLQNVPKSWAWNKASLRGTTHLKMLHSQYCFFFKFNSKSFSRHHVLVSPCSCRRLLSLSMLWSMALFKKSSQEESDSSVKWEFLQNKVEFESTRGHNCKPAPTRPTVPQAFDYFLTFFCWFPIAWPVTNQYPTERTRKMSKIHF